MTDAERKEEEGEGEYKTRISPLEDEKLFHQKVLSKRGGFTIVQPPKKKIFYKQRSDGEENARFKPTIKN